MTNALVWVDSWQMECCGDPFTAGSRVTWNVVRPDTAWLATVLGPDGAAEVTHAEEHHGQQESDPLTGVVTSIRAVSCHYAPKPGQSDKMLHPVPGSTVLTPTHEATGRAEADDRPLVGYLVEVAG